MAEIKLERSEEDTFNQSSVNSTGAMVCCCGFELIKQDEDTYRCSGGNHVYRFSEGSAMKDKFGNLLLKKDLPNSEEAKNESGL